MRFIQVQFGGKTISSHLALSKVHVIVEEGAWQICGGSIFLFQASNKEQKDNTQSLAPRFAWRGGSCHPKMTKNWETIIYVVCVFVPVQHPRMWYFQSCPSRGGLLSCTMELEPWGVVSQLYPDVSPVCCVES